MDYDTLEDEISLIEISGKVSYPQMKIFLDKNRITLLLHKIISTIVMK